MFNISNQTMFMTDDITSLNVHLFLFRLFLMYIHMSMGREVHWTHRLLGHRFQSCWGWWSQGVHVELQSILGFPVNLTWSLCSSQSDLVRNPKIRNTMISWWFCRLTICQNMCQFHWSKLHSFFFLAVYSGWIFLKLHMTPRSGNRPANGLDSRSLEVVQTKIIAITLMIVLIKIIHVYWWLRSSAFLQLDTIGTCSGAWQKWASLNLNSLFHALLAL